MKYDFRVIQYSVRNKDIIGVIYQMISDRYISYIRYILYVTGPFT